MVAIIQKPVVGTFIESKLDLIDRIRGETLQEIKNFFDNLDIKFGNLIEFLKHPGIYPGKSVGLEQIIERFLNVTISKYYEEIQAEGLPIKYVLNTIKENLFQGGWDIKRYSNITMATRGVDDARKAVSTSRIDEPPRLLPLRNKAYKAKSKPKPKKRGPKVKTIKKSKMGAKINRCDYCGSNARLIKIHINICQNPTHHHFCSDDCKISWIFGLIEINEKISHED